MEDAVIGAAPGLLRVGIAVRHRFEAVEAAVVGHRRTPHAVAHPRDHSAEDDAAPSAGVEAADAAAPSALALVGVVASAEAGAVASAEVAVVASAEVGIQVPVVRHHAVLAGLLSDLVAHGRAS